MKGNEQTLEIQKLKIYLYESKSQKRGDECGFVSYILSFQSFHSYINMKQNGNSKIGWRETC